MERLLRSFFAILCLGLGFFLLSTGITFGLDLCVENEDLAFARLAGVVNFVVGGVVMTNVMWCVTHNYTKERERYRAMNGKDMLARYLQEGDVFVVTPYHLLEEDQDFDLPIDTPMLCVGSNFFLQQVRVNYRGIDSLQRETGVLSYDTSVQLISAEDY